MKSKLLIFIFTILTLGLFMIPKCFAKYETEYFEKINLVKNVYKGGSFIKVYINSYETNNTYNYLTFQSFNKNTNLPQSILGYTYTGNVSDIKFTWFVDNTQYWNNYKKNPSSNNTGNCYTTTNNINYAIISDTDSYGAYIEILFQTETNRDYVYENFNFLVYYTTNNTNTGVHDFIPNEYYGLILENENKGVFTNFKTYLCMEATTSEINTTDKMITYNRIGLNEYRETIQNTNTTNTYQFYIKVNTNNYKVSEMPNLHFQWLQLDYITINNTKYSYTNALQQFNYLYNNIVLYNNNAVLFSTEDRGTINDTIQELQFSLINYNFINNSTYYEPSYGNTNYFANTQITTSASDIETMAKYYTEKGYQQGFTEGTAHGYNQAMSENTNQFDNLMYAVADVPMHIIRGLLDFEILGFNLLGFFMGIITLILFIGLIKRFKQ